MAMVIVLDQTYRAFTRISWQKAIRLWCRNLIEIVEAYTDKLVRSPSVQLAMPKVVRLLGYVAQIKTPKFTKVNLYSRDKGQCQYCGIRLFLQDATHDHIVPKDRGGQRTWENIVIACKSCNQIKGNRTPEEAGMKLLSKPVKPKSLPLGMF